MPPTLPEMVNELGPWLIIGLGNPGAKYEGTRHNVGADAVRALAQAKGVTLKSSKEFSVRGDIRLSGQHVILAVPTTYMNESGMAVGAIARMFRIEPEHVIVIHDELDLEPGTVRVKVGGGLAGHNGLRSITDHLHTQEFLRVRIGVGKPPGGKEHGANHVLKGFARHERQLVDLAIERASDAACSIIEDGIARAMTEANVKEG